MARNEKYSAIISQTSSCDDSQNKSLHGNLPHVHRVNSLVNVVTGNVDKNQIYHRLASDLEDSPHSADCQRSVEDDNEGEECDTNREIRAGESDGSDHDSESIIDDDPASVENGNACSVDRHFAIKPGDFSDPTLATPFSIDSEDVYNEFDDSYDDEECMNRYRFSDNHIENVAGSARSSLFFGHIQSIRNVRQEARRKRAEKALSMPSGIRSRMTLCLESWCDLADRGIFLFIGFVIIFAFVYMFISSSHPKAKAIFLFVGISLIATRLLWGPMYWFFWGRRIAKKRKATMKVFDGLNDETATAGHKIPVHETDMEMDERKPQSINQQIQIT
mmetsp:Transcript_27682/g.33674  ORF Transcript_27682/g.33674 Transcript_27682/m.33674 type:complete len:333 (+) Transcript_27682:88-1086(+)